MLETLSCLNLGWETLEVNAGPVLAWGEEVRDKKAFIALHGTAVKGRLQISLPCHPSLLGLESRPQLLCDQGFNWRLTRSVQQSSETSLQSCKAPAAAKAVSLDGSAATVAVFAVTHGLSRL